jgi:pyruvate dehydrogenase E2 component (dihydrolipoamide acetyltransferase)
VKVGAILVEFAEEVGADAGALVGRLPGHEKSPPPPAPPISHPEQAVTLRMKAMPAVRDLAKRLGVNLATLQPTGPDGEVTKADVEKAAARGSEAEEATGDPLRGVRRAMAANMAKAHAVVVPATAMDQADVDAWWQPQIDVTARLVRAAVAGCRASPSLNAWYDDRAQTRQLHARVDLGIAMDTTDGLFVPVLRNAGSRDAESVRNEIERLKSEVRSRRIAPDELKNQTITLSNFGVLGGRFAVLVVVPPQVAILGSGRVVPALVAAGSESVVHHVIPLSLTFDHRVVTGGEAARFLTAVIADLERKD